MKKESRYEPGRQRLGRRAFLATGLAAGSPRAVGVATGAITDETPGSSAEPRTLPVRPFGKTGLRMPILGFGGAGLPKAWYNPLSTEGRVKLVRHALDRGIRYFDTAPNYLESQSILGAALAGRRREAFLASKVETTRPDRVRASVEGSLKELRTDYVDLVLIHGTPGLEQMSIAQAMKIHAELVKLRDEKIIRHVGFSAHGYFDKALALIGTGGFDQCMLSYGYVPRGYDQVHSARMIALRDACVAKAHEQGTAIVAMKVAAAGLLGAWAPYVVPGYDRRRLERLPGAAIRFVLQDPRIQVLNIGMRLQQEVDANIRILAGATAYTLEDRALLAEFSARLYETDAIKKLRIE